MRHKLRIPAATADGYRLQRLGHRADLVHLDQRRVGHAAVDGVGDDLRVGDEDVVPDQLQPVAQPSQSSSASPSSISQTGKRSAIWA